MKTNCKNFVIITVLLLLATACTQKPSFTKQGYIENYENWIVELQKNYKKLNEVDWATIESDFERYSKTEYNIFCKGLTPEEKQKIQLFSGQFYAIKGKYKALQLKEKLHNLLDQAKGMVEEFKQE